MKYEHILDASGEAFDTEVHQILANGHPKMSEADNFVKLAAGKANSKAALAKFAKLDAETNGEDSIETDSSAPEEKPVEPVAEKPATPKKAKAKTELSAEDIVSTYKTARANSLRADFSKGGIAPYYRGGQGYNLKGIDLSGAELKSVVFTNCDLEGADFTNCDLEGANFIGANLKDAIFYGAILSFAIVPDDFASTVLVNDKTELANIYRANQCS